MLRRLVTLGIRVLRRVRRGVERRLPWVYPKLFQLYQHSGWIKRHYDRLKLRQLIDELAGMVEEGAEQQLLAPEVAQRLRQAVAELHQENRSARRG